MKSFDDLWRFINSRGSVVTVQEYRELEHVYNLIKDCKSYLEVGSAEGNTLYILGHNMQRIVYVDYGETHTELPRKEIISNLSAAITALLGNSHDHKLIHKAERYGPYDVVLIDAGHSYEDVVADAIAYGGMARKYLIFHDIQLPQVKAAFEWYVKQQKYEKVTTFINSDNFGYGIIEL